MGEESTAVALAPPQQHGLALRSLDDYLGFAKIAVESGLSLGHRNAASVVIAVQFGAELGLSPMASLRNVHVFQGKPVPSADLLVAVALSHPDCLYFRKITESATEATWETHRRGNPAPTRYSFTDADAKRAGLIGKDNWKGYTPRMLSARAKAFLARDVYPDRLAGILSVEEAQDIDEPVAAEPIEIRRVEATVVSNGDAGSAADDSKPGATISEPQAKRLYAMAKNAGHTAEQLKPWLLAAYGVEHIRDIRKVDYDRIIERINNVTPLTDAITAGTEREPGADG